MKPWFAVALVLVLTSACKGERVVERDPELIKRLDDCGKARDDQKTYIASLEKQLADGQLKGGGKVVVSFEGELMRIQGKGPRELAGEPKGSAGDAELYEAFVAALKRSHGSIQKCYQSALKNNTGLQARTITLDIEVDYRVSGQVSRASFAPRVSESFDQCMDAIARRWTLPAMPQTVTFAYKQSLTPE